MVLLTELTDMQTQLDRLRAGLRHLLDEDADGP
jgi:hypothetical protein